MGNLILNEEIEYNTVISRQTLYDMWATAGIRAVAGDFNSEGRAAFVDCSTGCTHCDGYGQISFEHEHALWRMFIDVVDDTGCSCYVAIGPDRFDEPMLATEPLPPRSMVAYKGSGRKVGMNWGVAGQRTFGVTLTDSTIPSGAWVPIAVEGMVLLGFEPMWASEISAPSGISLSAQPYESFIALQMPLVDSGMGRGRPVWSAMANPYKYNIPGLLSQITQLQSWPTNASGVSCVAWVALRSPPRNMV